jgi:hypothetical protein
MKMMTRILQAMMFLLSIGALPQNTITFYESGTTKQAFGTPGKALDAVVQYNEKIYILKLVLNSDLIFDDKFKQIYSGQVFTTSYDALKNIPSGLANLLFDNNNDFEGSLNVADTLIHYRKKDGKLTMERHRITSEGVCGVRGENYSNQAVNHANEEPVAISKSQSGNASCLPERKILPVAVACDCNFTKLCGGIDNAIKEIVKAFAQASSVFERHFNLSLGIMEIKAMPECHDAIMVNRDGTKFVKWNRKCNDFYTMNQRLSDFSEWQMNGFANSNPGVTHLITGCNMGPTVGLSWPGKMCIRKVMETFDSKTQFMAGASISSINPAQVLTTENTSEASQLIGAILAKIILHEISHVIGARHDCGDDCDCDGRLGCSECCPCSVSERMRDKQLYPDLYHVMENRHKCSCHSMYIMNSTTAMASLEFSPCSKDEICKNLRMYGGTCLKSPEHVQIISGGVCGNGIKEEGEECDCGSPEECANDPCCMQGCKLRVGATCSDSNDKCCRSCQIVKKEERLICRAAISPCDLDEICNGEGPSCPPDSFKPDGTICDSSSTKPKHLKKCASGICTNRHMQCQEVGRNHLVESECIHDFDSTDEAVYNHSKCRMHCQQTNGRCIILTNHYIDGTECGNQGKCHQGQCTGEKPSHRVTLLQKYFICLGISFLAALIISLLLYYLKAKKTVEELGTGPILESKLNNIQ